MPKNCFSMFQKVLFLGGGRGLFAQELPGLLFPVDPNWMCIGAWAILNSQNEDDWCKCILVSSIWPALQKASIKDSAILSSAYVKSQLLFTRSNK